MTELTLKLTTKRALEYEEKTGKDIIEVLQEIAETEVITVKTIVGLFTALGEGYDADTFESWDDTFAGKATKTIEACKEYIQGSKKN